MKRAAALFFLSFLCFQLSAKDRTLDSLKNVVKSGVNDSAKCRALGALAARAPEGEWQLYNNELNTLAKAKLAMKKLDPLEIKLYKECLAATLSNYGSIAVMKGEMDKALDFYMQGLQISREVGDKNGVMGSLQGVGVIYSQTGNYKKALECYEENLAMQKEIGNKKGIAISLNSIASILYTQGKVKEAIELSEQSMKLSEEIRDRTMIAQNLQALGYMFDHSGNKQKALEYFQRSYEMRKLLGDKQGMSISLGSIGGIYNLQGKTAKALENFEESLKMQEELGYVEGVAQCLRQIADIYNDRGNAVKALEYHHRSLKLAEDSKDKKGVAQAITYIALVYEKQGEKAKAMEYFKKALSISEELNDKQSIANSLANMASVYRRIGDPAITSSPQASKKAGILRALELYKKSLALSEQISSLQQMGNCHNAMGVLYLQIADGDAVSEEVTAEQAQEKAVEHLSQCLAIYEKMKDRKGLSACYCNIAGVYERQKKYDKALAFCKLGSEIAKEVRSVINMRNLAQRTYEISKKAGNEKLALENFELYIKMRDSISNTETKKAAIRSQLKYEYEKQSAADSVAHAKESEIKNVELKRQTAEIKAKKNQQYALFGGLFLVCLFGVFMFNRYKVTQKQKTVIEHQKEIVDEQKKLVEEKQREVLDSIHYAKRIQLALIPSEKRVHLILKRMQGPD
jgi:tetratricopeptide (TPR) repeat protein